jgi:hypothetical protein
MKKIYAFIITAVIAVSSVCIYSNKTNLSTLMDANVDALVQYETTMSITCKGAISIPCKKKCDKCQTEWQAIGGYGYGVGLSGRCICGKQH